MASTTSVPEKVIQLRKHLHQHPELSGEEKRTADTLREFLKEAEPTDLITGLGGHGLAAIFDSGEPGPVVLLRADMDALPIAEKNTFSYRSAYDNIAHLCGHDGHSAIMAGVALQLKASPPKQGKVVLLFQPAEETGEGAEIVINDPAFQSIHPDYAFALHNLPGFEKGVIFVREESFAFASTGIIMHLTGQTAHAANPENGNNPDMAMAQLITGINNLSKEQHLFSDFALATVIHARLGDVAFGTTPGKGVVMATLRTAIDSDMETLKNHVVEMARNISKERNLELDISYREPFPATINHPECVEIIKKGAAQASLTLDTLEDPFRWSEDFGHFTRISKAALFGIGAGTNHPQLHTGNYDFPDEIIAPAIQTFCQIIKNITQ